MQSFIFCVKEDKKMSEDVKVNYYSVVPAEVKYNNEL